MQGRRVSIAGVVAGAAIAAGILVPSASGRGLPQDSYSPSVSANGRFVAFQTVRDDLGGPLDADEANIYVYDRKRKRTQLVSRQSRSAGGAGADDDSSGPSISANGRYVAFQTDADNLGGPVDTGFGNVYVYDRKRRKVQLVSRQSRSAGGAGADQQAYQPSISANGRFVGIRTEADNLGGPIADVTNIYVYDRERKRIQLVSRASQAAGGAGGDEDSQDASLSANGRLVAISSYANNFGGPLDPDVKNVYVYDRKRKRMTLVSRQSQGSGGAGGDDGSTNPSLADNGRHVAFSTTADNLGGPIDVDVENVYVYDRKRKRVQLVSRRSRSAGGAGADDHSFNADISASGRIVAFQTEADNLGGPIADVANVYVYDRKRKKVQLASRQSRAAGGDGCEESCISPSISANGRVVGFYTRSDNLGGPDVSLNSSDVYVRDRKSKRTRLVSRPSR